MFIQVFTTRKGNYYDQSIWCTVKTQTENLEQSSSGWDSQFENQI